MDYEIIRYNSKGYTVKCKVCGHMKDMTKQNFEHATLSHNATNCRQDYYDNFINKVFGDYEVIEYLNDPKHTFKLRCRKCGVEESVQVRSLQMNDDNAFRHGVRCIKNVPDSIYKKAICERFNDIYQRCNNPQNSNYQHYGARNIKLEYEYSIDLYLDFIDELKAFAEKHGLRNATFDRIDVNGNYCKDNLRIATQSVQSTNTTRKKLFVLKQNNQIVLCDNAMEFGRYFNVNGRSVGNVIRGTSKTAGGWSLVNTYPPESNIDEIYKIEGVTTKLITT